MSLPAGERGLKFPDGEIMVYKTKSLPAGERGLKYILCRSTVNSLSSLPAGERGLKLSTFRRRHPDHRVAPRRGAWIEIFMVSLKLEPGSSRSPQGSVD